LLRSKPLSPEHGVVLQKPMHDIYGMIKLVLFEDNRDYVESLIEVLRDANDIELAGSFENCRDAVRKALPLKPDVILMDIDMPLVNGLVGLRDIRQENESVCILMFTVFDDNENVFQAICDGATGYLLKDTPPEKLLQYIREAYNGGAPMTPAIARKVLHLFSQPYKHKRDFKELTPREHNVLSLLVRGMSYKMAAAELKLSEETIRSHVKNIFSKLHVNSKSEAVARALQNKIV
jgi:DNA-binding NarL/FixJ family response regulator